MKTENPSGVFKDIHDIDIEVLEKPEITPDSIIIEVQRAGICGSDLHFYHEGQLPPGTVLGHEFTGHVIEVGGDVSGFTVGQRVAVNPTIHGTGLGGTPGGFARYVRMVKPLPGLDVFPVADSITDRQAAMLEPLSIAMAGVNHTACKITDNALVTGAGTIGMVSIAALKAKGIENIVVSDISEFNLEIAKKIGAKYTHNPKTDGPLRDFLGKLFGTVPAKESFRSPMPNLQTAIECTGVSPVLRNCLDSLAMDGNLTLLGIFSKTAEIDPNEIVLKRTKIVGSVYFEPEDFREAIYLTETGKIDLTPIVTHELPLSEIAEGFRIAADGQNRVKVMLNPKQ